MIRKKYTYCLAELPQHLVLGALQFLKVYIFLSIYSRFQIPRNFFIQISCMSMKNYTNLMEIQEI